MKKNWINVVIAAAVIIVAVVVVPILINDPPPTFALNGSELNLKKLKVSDMNAAGFYMGNNSGSLPGNSFKESLSYYNGDNKDVSMGGISVLNRLSSTRAYVDCEVFEISAKAYDSDGNLTGLVATYNGVDVFGKTKEELIALLGEPNKEAKDTQLKYGSRRNTYRTTFDFDKDTGKCYKVEIDRYEEGLVR